MAAAEFKVRLLAAEENSRMAPGEALKDADDVGMVMEIEAARLFTRGRASEEVLEVLLAVQRNVMRGLA